MTVLVITRGIPASGKTTFAKDWVSADPKNRVRVNRDDLRGMIHDGKFIPGVTEGRIIKARDVLIDCYLKAGVSVVCDDTNLKAKTVKDLMKLARKNGAEVRFQDFDTDPKICTERDRVRPEKVGDKVVWRFWKRYVKNGFPAVPELSDNDFGDIVPYEYPGDKYPTAFICDIDGTVAIHNGRSPFDETLVHLDSANDNVLALIYQLKMLGHEIIFVSGRHDSCREATEKWLIDQYEKSLAGTSWVPVVTEMNDTRAILVRQEAPWWKLFMRPAGDNRKDYEIKLEIFNREIRGKYNVVGVFDDRDQVVKLWRDLGLQTYQVNYGSF